MAMCTCAEPTLLARHVSDGPGPNSLANTVKKSTDEVNQTLYGSSHGGQKGVFDAIRFCHWAAPEYGDVGEGLWTDFFQAAGVLIAIANGVAQSTISDMRMDLAERYYDMAEYKWKRFKDKYMPLEKQILSETSSVPIKNIDCDGADSRAKDSVNSAYDGTEAYLVRMSKAYRICLDDSLLQYNGRRRATMMVDTQNYNLADERWFTDVKNDQRWNRRSSILNLGRNLSSTALSYGDVANAMLKQVGGQLDRAAGGVVQALGYYGVRNQTAYPTEFLGSASNPNIVSVGQPTGISPTGISPSSGSVPYTETVTS